MPPGKLPIIGTTGDVLTIPAPSSPAAFIRILSMNLFVTATSTVKMWSDNSTTGTQIGQAYLGTGNSYSRTDEVSGIMDAVPGQALVINNSAGTIAGDVTYAVMGAG